MTEITRDPLLPPLTKEQLVALGSAPYEYPAVAIKASERRVYRQLQRLGLVERQLGTHCYRATERGARVALAWKRAGHA